MTRFSTFIGGEAVPSCVYRGSSKELWGVDSINSILKASCLLRYKGIDMAEGRKDMVNGNDKD